MSEMISADDLRKLAADWMAAGGRVAGPRRVKKDLVQYGLLKSPDELLLDGFVHPANSLKELFLPRHEKLYSYTLDGGKVELRDADAPMPRTLVLAARPCDAAAVAALDKVFNWDYRDRFYDRRREATTIVTLACTEADDACFCTSVGLAPDSDKGADAMLAPVAGGRFEVRALTDKGRAAFDGRTATLVGEPLPAAAPPRRFTLDDVRAFVRGNFEHPLWADSTLRCQACGACAFTCPTCHCFDIVDEGGPRGGVRARNWDACQFSQFTLHASGHNPRTRQGQRQRQRVMHKFEIYPAKFGDLLCTGCGNCVRNCPAGLGVLSVLEDIEAACAAGEGADTAGSKS